MSVGTPLPPDPTVVPAPGGTASAAARPRIPALDGLRAIAVMAVVVYHVSPGALAGGYIGVDVFFVVSGFLITVLLVREHAATGRIALRQFWMRRARRLLPALAVLVLVTSSAALAVGGDALVGLGRQVLGAATFSSNWLELAYGNDYFDNTSADLFRNLWSLAVEEQFYLVWPLAVLALASMSKRSWRVGIVVAIAAASALAMAMIHTPGSDATRVYFGTDTHSFGLAIGAALAFALVGRSPALDPGAGASTAAGSRVRARFADVAAGALLASVLSAFVALPADDDLVYRGGLVGVALAVAGIIACALVRGSVIARALDNRLFRWIGERSYGIYLWHWPVFFLVVGLLDSVDRSGASGWGLGGIAAGVSVAAAALSFRFVERPIRRHGFRGVVRLVRRAAPTTRPRLVAGSIAVIVLASLIGTATAIAVSPSTSDAQSEIQEGLDAIATAPSDVSPPGEQARDAAADAGPPLSSDPITGDQITAIGDSVMLASAPELQAAFPGIAIDAAVSRQLSAAPAIIDEMVDADTLRPIVVLGLGTNGPIDDATLDELRDRVGPSHRIVVVSVYAPRGWTDGVNATLDSFAREYRDVELSDWRTAIASQTSLLSSDQVHPGAAGGEVYADELRAALQRLSEVPPLLRPNDYGLAPRPE
ncbi:acyltransferase family protein [Marisediminicola sp. LYQ134]|uniref:acyltransferase family protein n=1 Tax=Marisediminicola sp. LYQ134 TaxID=3391061 RepID=UPI00398361FC